MGPSTKPSLQFTNTLFVLCALSSTPVYADNALSDALGNGKATGNFRLRYESVSDEAYARNATGLTLRSRLRYETASAFGLSAGIEFRDVRVIAGLNEYQLPPPPTPSPNSYAVIPDPQQTTISNAYLRYRSISNVDVIYGRQRIILDNQRFVGNAGGRQNDQTFDAVSAAYTGLRNWSFYVAHVNRVNGVTDAFSSTTADDIFNASFSNSTLGKLTVYSYLLENKNPDSKAINLALQYRRNNTFGASAEGQHILSKSPRVAGVYRIEYATQTFENGARDSYAATYEQLEAGIRYADSVTKAVIVPRIGYQAMGSDGGSYGFQTPYATKNSFNGWDEKFLITPNEGLRSRYASVQTDLQNSSVTVILSGYRFRSDRRPIDFGNEWDVQILKHFGEHYTLGIRYADYHGSADIVKFSTASGLPVLNAANTDTKKLLMWAEFNF